MTEFFTAQKEKEGMPDFSGIPSFIYLNMIFLLLFKSHSSG